MQTIKKLLGALGKILLAEILKPIEEIKKEQKAQGERLDGLARRVEALHEADPDIVECDLASLDNQIGTRIAKCMERGYTTAEDRRAVTRMHEAYHKRGGNHGEENEYARFLQLKTKEEYERSKTT